MADVHEIRVHPVDDSEAEKVRNQAAQMLGVDVTLETVRVFYVEGVPADQIPKLTGELLVDPIVERADTSPRDDWENPRRVEVSYLPGVTNPVRGSLDKGAHLLDMDPDAVDSATEYVFARDTPVSLVEIVRDYLLVNKNIQTVRTNRPDTLTMSGTAPPVETVTVRGLDIEKLRELSKKRDLFLADDGMLAIQREFERLGREPTDAEINATAGRWSEHCGHPTFNARLLVNGEPKAPLFQRIKERAAQQENYKKNVPSAFGDNAGVFMFFDGMCICIKLETHNSPSALEPYGGAMTGTGGVLRDIMGTGKGAKNILSMDIFVFAPEDTPANELPVNCLPPGYIERRVIDGVRDYGNRFGVPTANGSTHYHANSRAKPTVMVGALGIVPEEYAQKGTPEVGDLVVAVGGRTGRDGIHGATFASGSMTSETASEYSSAVQIGDSITEKKMAEALLEARDAGCIRAITDCGAAGFSSAIGEIGEDIGVQVDISKAPLKYEGLAPWEIWMSESQERMVGAIIPEMWETFASICEKHEVEATTLGTFGSDDPSNPRLRVTYGDQQVIDLSYDFLKNGLPQRELIANWRAPEIAESAEPICEDWQDAIETLLRHGNVRSKESTVRQYDHEVQGTSVVKPYAGVHRDSPNDGVVLAPILGKPYGLVAAHGMNPVLNDIEPYRGSVWAFAEAAANFTAVGGNPDNMYAANNFVTASPDEHVMGVLDKMVDAICDSMDAFGAPIISGKDSLSSRFEGQMPDGNDVTIDIAPVLTITVAGGIPDVAKTVTSDIKRPGSTLVLVGKPDYDSMGGSLWYETADATSNHVPLPDLELLPKSLRSVHQAMQQGEVLSCHDVSEGGLAVTIAEMAFGGDCGVNLELGDETSAEKHLFNETAGCLVVEVEDVEAAKRLFGDVPHQVIGRTQEEKTFNAAQNGRQLFSLPVTQLKHTWKSHGQRLAA